MKNLEIRQCLVESGSNNIVGVFDEVQMKDNLFIVRNGSYVGLYNTNGKMVLPIKYDYISICNGFINPIEDSRMGLCDMEGNFIIEPLFESVRVCLHDYVLVFDGKKYGLYRIDGKRVLDVKYDHITILSEEDFIILYNGGEATIYFTKTGTIAPYWFDEYFEYGHGYITIYQKRDAFTYDTMGNRIIPPITR